MTTHVLIRLATGDDRPVIRELLRAAFGQEDEVELVDELLKNPKYIKRFDPANSLLYQYLSGAQTPQMPKGDDPLSAEQLTLVRAWIGEKPGGGTTTTATATATATATDQKKCIRAYCLHMR